MKIKAFFKIIIIITFLLLLLGIYKLSTFTLFEDNYTIIKNIKSPNKDYFIRIYHIPSNASSQSYIQVRKMKDNTEEILESYEQFDHLDNYSIKDDTLILKISFSISNKSEIKKISLK